MTHPKYDSSLKTLYGFGASRITRKDLSGIRKVFKHFQIDESNSSWDSDQEALRVVVSSTGVKNSSYVFNFVKLCRSRLFIYRQCIWLLNVQGSWEPIRYKWLQWEEDMAYALHLVIKEEGCLPYSSGGDAIRTIKDHDW